MIQVIRAPQLSNSTRAGIGEHKRGPTLLNLRGRAKRENRFATSPVIHR